jgi:AraC family transcriptional regulator
MAGDHRAPTATHDLAELELGAESLHARALHASPSVVISDVRCRPSDHGRSAEEWCTENHIVFPRQGVFVRHVAGQDVVADANHVLFFGRHEAYRVSHPAQCGDDCTVFAFAPEVLCDAVRVHHAGVDERPEQPFTFTHVVADPRVYLLHERVRQASQNPTSERLPLDEAALMLLTALIQRAHAESPAGPKSTPRLATRELHRDQSERTKLFLASTLGEPLALDDVAAAVHCSVFHLARVFRRETGLSIHQYRLRLRLRAGLERLVSGASDLSALAHELGFSSHSHFSDAFRAAFGLAPSACRRAIDGRRLRELSKNLEV